MIPLLRYTAPASPSRGAGIGVLTICGMKPHPARFAAFPFVPQFLVAHSRSRKTRRFCSAGPGTPTRLGHRPGLASRLVVVYTTYLEPIMADLFTGASAQITPFSFNSHAVRVIQRDGAPWFICADVAQVLGYRDASNAGRVLDDDEKGTHNLSTPGGDQRVTIINESGLYALVLRSRKPEARKFAKWVTSEVLPSLRKTGGYGTEPRQTLNQIVDRLASQLGESNSYPVEVFMPLWQAINTRIASRCGVGHQHKPSRQLEGSS